LVSDAYDRQTHTLLREVPRPGRSSQSADLVPNGDGSVDLLFGPEAPDRHPGNWIPTLPEQGLEILFRLYGPEPALVDKAWRLPDLGEPSSDGHAAALSQNR